jgi:polar amino acid transport system substrate-binding protein
MSTKIPSVRWLSALLVTSFAAACGGGEEGSSSPPDQLAPTGTLRVAIGVASASSAFWATPDPVTGEPRGVTVHLAHALAEHAGRPLELVVYSNSGNITEAGPKGEWDVTFMPIDATRAEIVDFGPTYYRFDSAILVPGTSTIQTLGEVNREGVRVAAVEGTTTARSAEALLTRAHMVYFGELEAVLAALRAGEVDGVALGRESLRSLLGEFPGARILDEGYNRTGVAVGVPRGNSEALAYVTSFMEEAIASGTVASALEAAGLQSSQPPTPTP